MRQAYAANLERATDGLAGARVTRLTLQPLYHRPEATCLSLIHISEPTRPY